MTATIAWAVSPRRTSSSNITVIGCGSGMNRFGGRANSSDCLPDQSALSGRSTRPTPEEARCRPAAEQLCLRTGNEPHITRGGCFGRVAIPVRTQQSVPDGSDSLHCRQPGLMYDDVLERDDAQ